MNRYAFYFDANGCSGCKACQVACKDRNGLEVGRLWRRVYEVSGGSWEKQGEAWLPQVYAYNLSVACNHCERAVCAEACPAGAIFQREDGIVLIDVERCIGCKYCSWVCPYGAPQYDWRSRSMTKCTFCVEDVEAGLAPACVAACPLRVLDFGVEIASRGTLAMTSGSNKELECSELVRAVRPLPEAEMTRPALYIQPHRDAGQAEQPPGRVANREEVRTGKRGSELPLVIFTVLAQMAVGAFIILGAYLFQTSNDGCSFDMACQFAIRALLATGIVFGIGMLVSFLHLGHPLRAYRALFHLRTSWLSREILMVGVFGACWMVFDVLLITRLWHTDQLWGVYGLTTLAGLAMIFCMAKVYQMDSMLAWKSWRTSASFYLTMGLLGLLFSAWQFTNDLIPRLALLMLLPAGVHLQLITITATVGIALLVLDLAMEGRHDYSRGRAFWPALARLALISAAMLPLAAILGNAEIVQKIRQVPDLLKLAFLLALGAQLIGRWQFYERVNEREL